MTGPWRGCAVTGCERQHDSHGYCGMHAKRWLRTGCTDPRPVGARPNSIVHGTYPSSEACRRQRGSMCPSCRVARAAYERGRRQAVRERQRQLVRRAVQRQQVAA